MGPLISARQLRAVEEVVDEAVAPGGPGRLVCGGRRMRHRSALDGTDLSRGHFYPPTVVASSSSGGDGDGITTSRLWRDEVFGPVVALVGFETEAEAIALANDSDYGLGAAIWTQDLAQAFRVSAAITSGIVWVNTHHRNDPSSPWGGATSASGVGSENGLDAYHAYTTTKSIVVNYASNDQSLAADDWFREDAEDVRYG
ncbi:hypothetical protein CDD83_3321 [Cordyceps sp. RAO-2017]|nr:hypothetical protein CDD83_3321 [Cordyceps sp. RAO-2017]